MFSSLWEDTMYSHMLTRVSSRYFCGNGSLPWLQTDVEYREVVMKDQVFLDGLRRRRPSRWLELGGGLMSSKRPSVSGHTPTRERASQSVSCSRS